jgi:hypothetical protein
MKDWQPTEIDILEANRYWTICDAVALGPIELAEQLVLYDPEFADVFIDCLERALAMYPKGKNCNNHVTKVA